MKDKKGNGGLSTSCFLNVGGRGRRVSRGSCEAKVGGCCTDSAREFPTWSAHGWPSVLRSVCIADNARPLDHLASR
jgi:hypothetical protein